MHIFNTHCYLLIFLALVPWQEEVGSDGLPGRAKYEPGTLERERHGTDSSRLQVSLLLPVNSHGGE